MIHCLIMYGLGGRAYSAGMEDKLAARLRVLPGVQAPSTLNYGAWTVFAAAIKELPPGDKVMIAGHSLGAAMTTHIAHRVYPRAIDLLVGYDCTAWSRQMPVPPNVKQVLEFRGHTWVNPLGFRLLRKGAEAHYETYSRPDSHIAFDDDLFLHNRVIERVMALGG